MTCSARVDMARVVLGPESVRVLGGSEPFRSEAQTADWNGTLSMKPQSVPDVVFHTRVRNDTLGGPNPFEWKDVSTDELFAGKNIVLFAVPGAFTPACSDSHLPGYEKRYDDFRAL